jgi:uroporphyrinogen decarboxylase
MNKIERVNTVLAGGQPDCVPAGFWFHYSGDLSVNEMIDAHVKTFRETDVDLMKVMQDYVCRMDMKVQTASDWKKVKYPGISSPVYRKLADVLKGIVDKIGQETLIFQTIYGPFKNAVFSFGDDVVMAHAKEAPDLVAEAVKGIASSMCEWIDGFMSLGITGLYYSAQFTEPGRFTREQWEKLVRPADLMIIRAAEAKGAKNILHICGEPEYKWNTSLEWIDYPAAIVNWSVKDTGVPMSKGRELFKKPILGGMDNKGSILSGSPESIRADAAKVITDAGKKAFILGADCTIQGKSITHERIRAAVDAAHDV